MWKTPLIWEPYNILKGWEVCFHGLINALKNVGWVVLSISKKVFFLCKGLERFSAACQVFETDYEWLCLSSINCHTISYQIYHLSCIYNKFSNNQKKMVKCCLLVAIYCRRVQVCKHLMRWKNYSIRFFSSDQKIVKIFVKQSQEAYSKNAQHDAFEVFYNLQFVYQFWRKKPGKVFPMN